MDLGGSKKEEETTERGGTETEERVEKTDKNKMLVEERIT